MGKATTTTTTAVTARAGKAKKRPAGRKPVRANPLDGFDSIAAFRALSPADREAASLYMATADLSRDFRPLSPAERQRWEDARRKGGRPTVGKGAKPISVTVERGLLSAADAYAQQQGISRAELIARGLRAVVPGVPPEPAAPVGAAAGRAPTRKGAAGRANGPRGVVKRRARNGPAAPSPV